MKTIHQNVRIIIVFALLYIIISACTGSVPPTASETITQTNSPAATAPAIPTSTFTLATQAPPAQAPTLTPTLNPYNGPVKISGYVKDENGKPVKVAVAFEGFDIGDQGFVNTDANGYYEKQLAPAKQYIVSAEPGPDQQIGKYTFPARYLPQRQLVIRNGSETRVDFVMRIGGIVWLQAYTSSGSEMSPADFVDSSMVGAYPLGTFPYGDTIQAQYHGFPLFWGWIPGTNKNIACLMLPPDEPAEIWVAWRLPETGTTFLHADNDGKGFSAESNIVTPINLVYEFARTEYRRAARQLQELQAGGYTFSTGISTLLTTAQQNLSLAENKHKQGAESASAVSSYQVLTAVIKAREELALEQARQDIEKNRKGTVSLTLTDDQGKPLPNAKVEYRQVSHDFLFASGWSSLDNYANLKAAGFEYSYFGTWWEQMEPSPGNYTFPDAEMTQFQKSGLGFITEIGPQFSPGYYVTTAGYPLFAASDTPPELISRIQQFSHAFVSHYQGKLKLYDAFVEPDLLQVFNLSLPEFVDIVKASMQGARQSDPKISNFVLIANPIFNSLVNLRGSYSATYSGEGILRTGYNSPAHSGYEFVQALEAANADFDTVGLEYYYGAPNPPIDLGLFADSLDFNSTLGKKIFIGELNYPTLEGFSGVKKFWEAYGGWHAGYTEQAQAEWAADTLIIAFSKPYVNGYEWGITNDNGTDYYLLGMGLYHQNHITPRPALSALHDLIASWTTSGNGITDAAASLSFRGYGGDYELKIISADGQIHYAKTHITEQQNNQIQLTVDTTSPVFKSIAIDPKSVKNGDTFEITADAGETRLAVTADISQLDSTETEPVVLDPQADGTYTARVRLGIGNTIANGSKQITLAATDSGKNTGTTNAGIMLNNPAPVLDAVPPDDSLGGKSLDTHKWRAQLNGGGTVTENGRLILSEGSTPANSNIIVQSNWEFSGDFDAQVNFQIGPGWATPAHDHLDGATFGVAINGQTYHITRLRSVNQDEFFTWSNQGTLTAYTPSTVLSGKYRLVRSGTTLTLLYNIGHDWQELADVAVPPGPAQVYLANASVNASMAFTSYFDHFQINSGLTTYKP